MSRTRTLLAALTGAGAIVALLAGPALAGQSPVAHPPARMSTSPTASPVPDQGADGKDGSDEHGNGPSTHPAPHPSTKPPVKLPPKRTFWVATYQVDSPRYTGDGSFPRSVPQHLIFSASYTHVVPIPRTDTVGCHWVQHDGFWVDNVRQVGPLTEVTINHTHTSTTGVELVEAYLGRGPLPASCTTTTPPEPVLTLHPVTCPGATDLVVDVKHAPAGAELVAAGGTKLIPLNEHEQVPAGSSTTTIELPRHLTALPGTVELLDREGHVIAGPEAFTAPACPTQTTPPVVIPPKPTTSPTTAPTTPAPTVPTHAPTPSGPATTEPAPAPSLLYRDCADVIAAGKAPLHRGQPGYRVELDSDGDGVACERETATPIPMQPAAHDETLPNTGSPVALLALAGVLALVVGAIVTAAARRRAG